MKGELIDENNFNFKKQIKKYDEGDYAYSNYPNRNVYDFFL